MTQTPSSAGLLDLELPVEVWLASEEVELSRLMSLEPGGVLPLAKSPDDPVSLVANGIVVATGHLVVTSGKLGFRVASVEIQNVEALNATAVAKEKA